MVAAPNWKKEQLAAVVGKSRGKEETKREAMLKMTEGLAEPL